MKNNRKKLLLACIFLVSCASKEMIMDEHLIVDWKQKALESRGYSPTAVVKTVDAPEEIKKQEPEIKEADAVIEAEKELPKNRVTIKLNDVDVVVALRALARTAGQNILIDSEIKGNMSIHIVETPWNQAFSGILKIRKLGYKVDGNIIRVMTLEDMDFALENEAKMMARNKKVKELEPLLPPQVIPINYSDAKKIQANLVKVLSKKSSPASALDKDGAPVGPSTYGSVSVDEHTNSLIVQATREDMKKMVDLINKLDKPIKQILIEAHIVEANKDTAHSLGIQWGGVHLMPIGKNNLYTTPGLGLPVPSAAGTGTATGGGVLTGNRGYGISFPANPVGGGAPGILGLSFGTLAGNVLDIQLSALEKQGKLKIVSRPSITTLDNQMAFTENGTRIPFVTTASAGGALTQDVEFIDAVLRMEITPHVIEDKDLKMKIVIQKDEVDESRSVGGNPFITKKQTATNLIVEDGSTIVISGLTKEVQADSQNGVPGFKKIPFLGRLFKNENDSNTMEEVLIFITPHILKPKI